MGKKALWKNTTGASNVAIGHEALKTNTTASSNTSIGYASMLANTTGSDNAAFGANALTTNTTASSNSAFGYHALRYNTTGYDNTAMGMNALTTNTIGFRNTALGKSALKSNTTADYNTGLGFEALEGVTTGDNNIGIGKSSSYLTTTGSNNIAIGFEASPDSSSGDNAIVIGTSIQGDPNRFLFGKAGNRVFNTFTSNASWARSSDERKKTDIADATLGLDFINDLSTKTFKWKRSQDIPNTLNDYDADVNHMDTDVVMHGMLAQDVKAALDTAGVTTFGGWAEESDGSQSLSQEMFIYPLIKAIQELSTEVKLLKTQIGA